jgi:hypothetical protein
MKPFFALISLSRFSKAAATPIQLLEMGDLSLSSNRIAYFVLFFQQISQRRVSYSSGLPKS